VALRESTVPDANARDSDEQKERCVTDSTAEALLASQMDAVAFMRLSAALFEILISRRLGRALIG
jgi:hypothetical protein